MNYNSSNIEKERAKILKQDFYLNSVDKLISSAKQSHTKDLSSHQKGCPLYSLLLKTIEENGLNRIQSYVLTSITADLCYELEIMNDAVDSEIDWMYSRLNGDCPEKDVLRFDEDPVDEDIRAYASSYKWTSITSG